MAVLATRTIVERSDDIPLLIHWLQQLELAPLLDRELPPAHGNRQGLSYGELSVLLLTYIMSQADHRLCAVEPWVNQHLHTLEQATGWQIGDKDTSDDRLASLVEVLGKHGEARERIEVGLGEQMIHAYALPTTVTRVDTTSFSVYHQLDEAQAQESILRFGYSKDHRPDLRQYRQLLGTLDPLGVPLISETLPGNGADDNLYVPAWQRMAQVLGHTDFLLIADCKAASLANRAQIAQAGGFYCFPAPLTGHTAESLKHWVLNPPAAAEEICLELSNPAAASIGLGFEMEVGKLWSDPDTQESFHWSERYLVVRSDALAKKQIRGLHQRLERAEQALAKLAAKPVDDEERLQSQARAILKRYRVSDSFRIDITYQLLTHYRGPGRPKDGLGIEIQYGLTFERQLQAIDTAERLAGWRIYLTNTTPEQLSLAEAIAYYREQWQMERGFHRFKRGALPALPIYLQNENRIAGLMFLLTIALRLFTLIEFVVRQQLKTQNASLAGLYAGNPKRSTQRPSAEQLLRAFRDITLVRYRDGTAEMTPLSNLQRQILALMLIPTTIYDLPP